MSDKALTILYGTETGNSRQLAKQVAKRAEKNGVTATVCDLADYSVEQLAAASDPVLIIISTWDDGEPPAKARPFVKALTESSSLPGLRYTVLALGDQEYPAFCEAGKKVDAALEKAGAERFLPRADLGADFQVSYMGWAKKFWGRLAEVYGVTAA